MTTGNVSPMTTWYATYHRDGDDEKTNISIVSERSCVAGAKWTEPYDRTEFEEEPGRTQTLLEESCFCEQQAWEAWGLR